MGSASAFANQNISPLEVDFMVNAVQWVLGRSDALGISPKTPKDFSVSLDDGQQRMIMLSTLLGIPAVTGILELANEYAVPSGVRRSGGGHVGFVEFFTKTGSGNRADGQGVETDHRSAGAGVGSN